MKNEVGDRCQINGKIGEVSSIVFRSRTVYLKPLIIMIDAVR